MTTLDLNKFHIHDAPYVAKLLSGLLAEPHQADVIIWETAAALLRDRHDDDETARALDGWASAHREMNEESAYVAREEARKLALAS